MITEDYAMALHIDVQRKTSGPRNGHSAPELEAAAGGDSAEGNLIRAVYRPAADSRGDLTLSGDPYPQNSRLRDMKCPSAITNALLSSWMFSGYTHRNLITQLSHKSQP